MAKKRAKRKATKRKYTKRKSAGWTKCKYVGTRGSKLVANRLASELKRDCYRPLVQKPREAHEGYTISSCGKVPNCTPKAKRRKRKR